ncbi:copper amine oxidase N-terminal domain-containing protein [Acetivibrio mesophilus]|uniref:Copper amine oxidase N-terminal domain-containing protein n=1 Tax=Acetivibrio mesophilus TaxID=2487273 RepID=A0A4Q0I2T7_9FIRM|nr:copper amine oxidase N-terminal domain-containing protein [Acetivibrio mesophilus]RXE58526.1 copper amine oxidase N-terminal domain-containing protein [Acetivibrio mesophilus]
MFKKMGIIVVIAATISCFFMFTCSADSNSEVLVDINNVQVKMDIPPRIVNGEVFVPVRETLNLFGMEVEWDHSLRTAVAAKENKAISIKAESNKVLINDKYIDFNSSSFIHNDRLFISAEIFEYGFGMVFNFDSEKNILNVWSMDENDITIGGNENIMIKDCIDSIINITRRYRPDKINDEMENANKLYDDSKYIEAIESYEKILEGISSKKNPEEYGYINLSIGHAYLMLSQNADMERNAINAIAAYKQALTVDSSKIQGAANYSLGHAYNMLSKVRDSVVNNNLALEYLDSALKVFKLENYPLEYARIQLQKGSSYIGLYAWGGNVENIHSAISAIEEALTIFEEEYIIGYAMGQNNLGICYSYLSYSENPRENLNKAIEAYEDALTFFNKKEFPYEYTNIKNNRGLCYINLANINN